VRCGVLAIGLLLVLATGPSQGQGRSSGTRTIDATAARLVFGPSAMTLRDVQETTNAERTTQVYRFTWPKYRVFSGNVQYVRIRGPILKSVETPADADRAFKDLWPRHRSNPPRNIEKIEAGSLLGYFARRTSAVACGYFFLNDPSPAYQGSLQGYVAGEFCAAEGNSVSPQEAEAFLAVLRPWVRAIRLN